MARLRSAALLLLVGAGALLAACTDSLVFGSIPPSTFHFSSIVPHDGVGTGGWKAAQVTILLGRLSAHYPEAASCDIEVGVPVRNFYGPVPDFLAQEQAALAADKAARQVLQKQLPTALACEEFLKTMQLFLAHPATGTIPGAQVTRFLRTGLPRSSFP